ncbi:hypothetical protein IW262DRAFT_1419701 [Armillaria fumosa]|nr:hypothetical protein IW262DRAFT_1419701 [Armillaria fumosa]
MSTTSRTVVAAQQLQISFHTSFLHILCAIPCRLALEGQRDGRGVVFILGRLADTLFELWYHGLWTESACAVQLCTLPTSASSHWLLSLHYISGCEYASHGKWLYGHQDFTRNESPPRFQKVFLYGTLVIEICVILAGPSTVIIVPVGLLGMCRARWRPILDPVSSTVSFAPRWLRLAAIYVEFHARTPGRACWQQIEYGWWDITLDESRFGLGHMIV